MICQEYLIDAATQPDRFSEAVTRRSEGLQALILENETTATHTMSL